MTTAPPGSPPKPPRKRGFAALDAHARSLISAAGGRAAHAQGVAHRFDSAEGRSAADTRYRKRSADADARASRKAADKPAEKNAEESADEGADKGARKDADKSV